MSLPENEWRWALARLRQARLIEDHDGPVIDAHPLVREHFAARLQAECPEAWRAGHGRLYEHLRDTAKPLPDTLAEMAPLFQRNRPMRRQSIPSQAEISSRLMRWRYGST